MKQVRPYHPIREAILEAAVLVGMVVLVVLVMSL